MTNLKSGSAAKLIDAPDRRPWKYVLDILFAVFIGAVVSIGTHFAGQEQIAEGKILNGGTFVLVWLAAGTLATRRRLPTESMLASMVLMWIYLGLENPYGPMFIIPPIAIFFFAAAVPMRRAAWVIGALYVVNLVLFSVFESEDVGFEWAAVFGDFVWLVVPAIAGASVREVRRSRARVQTAEREQRRADERVAMAKEIHDVVGHSLAVVSMNAGVALHLLEKRPDAAPGVVDNLRAIRATSTRALDDLRATLAPLRQGQAADLRPEFGLDDLPELVENVRQGGLAVRYHRSGESEPPPGVAATAYRVVQEALTNVIRHAAATTATVDIDCRPGLVVLDISDNGRGGSVPSESPGHGIAGMAERADAHGGVFRAGPSETGGFAVHAELPYTTSGAPHD